MIGLEYDSARIDILRWATWANEMNGVQIMPQVQD